jgi:drug/metabolite transporter (DMT)-like permease
LAGRNFRVHLFLWITAIIHGANYSIAKDVMPEYIGAYGFILMRQAFATVAFFGLGMFLNKRHKAPLSDWKLMVASAFFGAALNMLTFFKGLSLTSPIQASLIMVMSPGIVTLLSWLVLKDRLRYIGWVGLALGFAGTAWLILAGQPGHQFRLSQGDLYIFINAVSYGIFLVISKPLMGRYHYIWLTKWLSLFGFLMALPFGAGELMQVQWSSIPPAIWASIIYVLVFTTVTSFILYGYALTHGSTSVVSSYIYLQPLLATAFAILLGKDHLTWTKVLAGSIIIAGVYLVNRGKRLKPMEQTIPNA